MGIGKSVMQKHQQLPAACGESAQHHEKRGIGAQAVPGEGIKLHQPGFFLGSPGSKL